MDPSQTYENGPSGRTLGASPAGRRPHVVLLGGQDAPSIQRLRERWKRSLSSLLPPHDLTVVEWPNPRARRGAGRIERLKIEPSGHSPSLRRLAAQGRMDRLVAGAARSVISGLDKHIRFDEHGRARSVLGSAIYQFTRFSVDALYNRDGLGDALVSLTTRALAHAPVDLVVGHSFGGTVALRAAWALQEQRVRSARFALLTLGTASGYTVERAPMFASFWRARGIERSDNIVSWKHFYSRSDAIVGSGQMPRSFRGVELIEVHTGPFLQRGRGHAITSYLATPRVRETIAGQLHRDRLVTGLANSPTR